ncbi:hypothetical protein H072_3474 [Dactylellina haptotyla CBS 200.50]|uniref:SGNH hydrolase-type esterase domain-containing protein n=1 Tax=Dactylellina haptotyla (strain CBS 200.50) TaxID=1284197 RepID=S8AN24_DACHA|nr:hypothetical protein H072_3474 [Dactylellina haptotyla CBS 200.50]
MTTYSYPSILIFGDSITQGIWKNQSGYSPGAALNDIYSRKLQVLERGFAGYNTANARYIVNKIIPPANGAVAVKLLVLWLGANDCILSTAASGQHVPLAEYKANLKAIINSTNMLTHIAKGAKVIIVAPPAYNEYQGGAYNADHKAVNHKAYAEAAGQVAAEMGHAFLDMWTIMMNSVGWQTGDPLIGDINVASSSGLASLLQDGLHPSAAGYKLFYQGLRNITCSTFVSDLCSPPKAFPDWNTAPKYTGPLKKREMEKRARRLS